MASVSKIQLPSYLPEPLYRDRRALGLVIDSALVAMLDHRRKKTGGATVASVELLVYIKLNVAAIREQLDEIILDQAVTIGAGIFASEIAHSRCLEWEHHDYAKYKRLLGALNKAAQNPSGNDAYAAYRPASA